MRTFLLLITVFVSTLNFPETSDASAPCEGVTQKFSAERKSALEFAAARQLNISSASLIKSFSVNSWFIVYIDTHQSDEAFLFYSDDPTRVAYLNIWSGAAMRTETSSLEAWALRNTPGIPSRLASCFAWYATNGR
jgi:hypothetical protein